MESTSNPVFNDGLVKKVTGNMEKTDTMTISGTVGKIAFLLLVLIAAGAFAWSAVSDNIDTAWPFVMITSLVSFVIALVIIFTKPNPLLTTLYAAGQGAVLGSISFVFNAEYQSIVAQAILLTVSITLSMLILYSTRIIKVTEKLRAGITVATFGVLIFYLASWLISLFSDSFASLIYDGSSASIIAGIIVFIAALNLLLDFDFIEKGSKQGLPKQFEWYGAFGLMVTLIWLYLSILRFLAASNR